MKDDSPTSQDEYLDRAMLGMRILELMNRLNAVSVAAANGQYHKAYKACGQVEDALNDLATDCFNLDEEYNK